jgi:hypothetical protein
VAGILRDAGHDVALARDQALAGAEDDRLLSAASAEGLARGFVQHVLTHRRGDHALAPPPSSRRRVATLRNALHCQTPVFPGFPFTTAGVLLARWWFVELGAGLLALCVSFWKPPLAPPAFSSTVLLLAISGIVAWTRDVRRA